MNLILPLVPFARSASVAILIITVTMAFIPIESSTLSATLVGHLSVIPSCQLLTSCGTLKLAVRLCYFDNLSQRTWVCSGMVKRKVLKDLNQLDSETLQEVN